LFSEPESDSAAPDAIALTRQVTPSLQSSTPAKRITPSRYEAIAVLDTEENEAEKWAGELCCLQAEFIFQKFLHGSTSPWQVQNLLVPYYIHWNN
jgi:hypothetical protein